MLMIASHQLQLSDHEQHRWTFDLDATSGYKLRVSRDEEPVGRLSEHELRYILGEHDDDCSAAQALCNRLYRELVGELPLELKTALFAGLSTWIRRYRIRTEDVGETALS